MTSLAEQTIPTPDPDYAGKVRESFKRQAFMGHLGAELTAVGPGTCEIRIPYREALTQQHGFFHGGCIGALADVTAGYAGYTTAPADATLLTVEYKISMVAPGKGEALVGRGRVIRAGRTIVTIAADIFAVDGVVETLCATALQTIMIRHGRPDSRSADRA
ncbi:MAG: PaaI family thioesterase [Alphaproteobacteria bacterium]|nr:PaaI family thioesterase [Alphaproteobacteria bacterium]